MNLYHRTRHARVFVYRTPRRLPHRHGPGTEPRRNGPGTEPALPLLGSQSLEAYQKEEA